MPSLHTRIRSCARLRCWQFAALAAVLAVAPAAQGETATQGSAWNGWHNATTLQGSAWNGWSNATSLQGASLSVQGTQLVSSVAGEIQVVPAATLLTGRLANGGSFVLRIDSVEQDPTQTLFESDSYRSNRDVQLYTLSFQDPEDSRWQPLCAGGEKALFLEGMWDPGGGWKASSDLFTVSCTDGVLAKCVRWGYKPWKTARAKSGKTVSLRDLHQACVRAARADYCGDGTSYTREGTLIDLWDANGLVVKISEKQSDPGFSAEASFGTEGAGCIEKARYDEYRPECPSPEPQVFGSSTPKSKAANPDDRVPCVNQQDAKGNTQLIFTESSTYCPHAPTDVGASLNRDCSACTKQVCGKYKHCCGMDADSPSIWDETCVEWAEKVCH